MKLKLSVLGPALLAACITGTVSAGTTEKHLIALKTNDFTLAETDVSDLALGEARTVVTDSGQTVDIIRTAEGFDIFVDGEQLEIPELHSDAHQVYHRNFAIECVAEDGAEADCGDEVFIADGDWDVEMLHGDGDAKVIIEKVHSECFSENKGECDGHAAWVSDGDDDASGELHGEALHFGDGSGTKVIRVHREHSSDADVVRADEDRDVIVIRKSRED